MPPTVGHEARRFNALASAEAVAVRACLEGLRAAEVLCMYIYIYIYFNRKQGMIQRQAVHRSGGILGGRSGTGGGQGRRGKREGRGAYVHVYGAGASTWQSHHMERVLPGEERSRCQGDISDQGGGVASRPRRWAAGGSRQENTDDSIAVAVIFSTRAQERKGLGVKKISLTEVVAPSGTFVLQGRSPGMTSDRCCSPHPNVPQTARDTSFANKNRPKYKNSQSGRTKGRYL